jgi:hypothetical protein
VSEVVESPSERRGHPSRGECLLLDPAIGAVRQIASLVISNQPAVCRSHPTGLTTPISVSAGTPSTVDAHTHPVPQEAVVLRAVWLAT